jgi:hypothetical protein
MITNTNCKKCLFANKASSDTPCEHNIIEHIKGHKKTSIVDDFYVIEEYMCRMGFNKDVFEKNKDNVSIDVIKQEIINKACMGYYAVIDITTLDPAGVSRLCETLIGLSIKPKFVSFLLFPDDSNKEKILALKNQIGDHFMWKAHSFISEISFDDALNVALDTNVGKNNTSFLLIYDAKNIAELDEDINELNSHIVILQTLFHYAKKKKADGLGGLFMTFSNYNICRSINKNIEQALSTIPEAIVLEYGNH